MVLKKSEQGFTLLSSLIGILIIGMMLPLVASLYQAIAHMPSYTDEISTQQFFQFLRDELAKAASYSVEDKKLTITLHDGTRTTIEKYDDVIRRQVAEKGHEIYLRHVKNILFESLSYDGIKATITLSNGDKYVKHIMSYP